MAREQDVTQDDRTKRRRPERLVRGGLAELRRGFRARRHIDPRDARHGTVPEGATSFGIATWNIHSCVGIDARFAPDRISEVIRQLGVDIIGLQEVGWHHRGEAGLDQFEYIAKATGMIAYPMPTKHHSHAHYGNGLFTRLPVLAARPIPLTIPHREPRGGIDAEIVVGDRVVRVLIAHLGLDPWERNAQITRILQVLDTGPKNVPTVFMGDLNEWRAGSPRLRRLVHHLPDCAAPRSFHARLPTLRLDRIFVSPELQMTSYEVVRNELTRRASDHLPVRAVMALG